MDRAINIPARRAYAELLRHVFSGRLTSDEADYRSDQILEVHGSDAAVDLIHESMDSFYGSERDQRFADKRMPMSPGARRVLARWVAMLYSRMPPASSNKSGECLRYEAWRVRDSSWLRAFALGIVVFIIGPLPSVFAWFYIDSMWWILLGMTVGCLPIHVLVFKASSDRSAAGHGMAGKWHRGDHDDGAWPFASIDALNAAIRHPVLLSGARELDVQRFDGEIHAD